MMTTGSPDQPSGKNFAAMAREANPTIDIKELRRIQKLLGDKTVDLIEQGYEASAHTEGDKNE
jgi:hypothetical protein